MQTDPNWAVPYRTMQWKSANCFFHRTTNWTLNSQVSGVAIQLRLRYYRSLKPCELQKSFPNHQSSFCWICLLLLTLSSEDHQILLSTLSSLDITGTHLRWFGSYLTGLSFKVAWPYITGSHHTGTWFLLPLLCWWHTALSLISTWWSNGSCTDLRLPGGHLGMDERTPSTAQPGKDWASCLPCNSNSIAWFHDSVRFINNYPISFGQKSWCNLRWPADLQRAHCKECSILQVCTTQHPKDQALSDRACCTTSCPGHF